MPRRYALLGFAVLLSPTLLAAPPDLAETLLRARDRLDRGDRRGARSELMTALRAFPSEPAIQNFLGVVEAQEGNYRAAEARFREAVRRAPRLTDAHLNLGRLYQENAARDPRALAQALAAYESVLAYDPVHPESLYQSAVLLQAAGEPARSLERLERLPDGERVRAQVLALRCAALAGVGDHAGADRAADSLLLRSDLTELDVAGVLPTLSARGRGDLGLRLIEGLRARGLAPPEVLRAHSVELLMDLARDARTARDHRGALGYLAHARELDPNDARVHFLFGMICVELDLGVEAHSALKEATRLDPGNAAYNYAMGAVSLHRHDTGEALPYFRRYAELRPEDPRGPLVVGLAAFRSGDFDSARRELARAAQSPSTAVAAHYFLARIAREENELDRALALVEKALAADAAYADAWAERGLLHLRMRDLGAAERDLGRSLELDADNYLGNLHLLALYQRTRDPREAAQATRMKELDARREQKSEEFRRVIEARPYE